MALAVGGTATFTVAATGAPTPSVYQWQRQPADASTGFVNLANDATYSGVTTATLAAGGRVLEIADRPVAVTAGVGGVADVVEVAAHLHDDGGVDLGERVLPLRGVVGVERAVKVS